MERIPGVPVASQEEAISTEKMRGTPGSCHKSNSPAIVSVHSRGTRFSCPGSTFTPRIDSYNGGTWDSPGGKPRGKPRMKSSRESHRSLDRRDGKRDTAPIAREESARACPYSRRVVTPLGSLRSTPRSMSALERNPQVPAPTPHEILGPGIDPRGIPRDPP